MNASILVLGSHNRKKCQEMVDLLAPQGIAVRSLADYPSALQVVEDGETFAENARRKAVQQARHLRAWVLGEDSGLCVDALQGAPGVYSARYSGPEATDERNNRKLLEALEEIPSEQRTAHYACYMELSDPEGNVRAQSHGQCCGRIRREYAGSAGFGYDPLFEIVEYHRTFGELGGAVKTVISHRARAMRQILPQIIALLGAPGQLP